MSFAVKDKRARYHPAVFLTLGASLVLGLAIGRLLYETLFPRLTWLGRPLPAVLLGAVAMTLGWALWRWLVDRTSPWRAVAPFLPLLLNLAYLPASSVNPLQGWFFLLVGLWLALVMAMNLTGGLLAKPRMGFALVTAFLAPIYLLTMGQSVGRADTFEFQVVVPRLGIVHPTGYPLFLLLSKPFTLLPLGSVAWRVNLATVFFALAAVCLVYWLLQRLTEKPLAAVLGAVMFGLTPTYWSQAVEAEVYALHALVVAAALLLMQQIGGWQIGIPKPQEQSKRSFSLLMLLALTLGLGLTNHLTTIILLPAAGLTVFAARQRILSEQPGKISWRPIMQLAAAFLLPLLLYAYLPLRWQAVNGEAMGAGRFVDWIVGGRFQGALQLTAWLRDPVRYTVTRRLITAEWSSAALLLALLGFMLLLWRGRMAALVVAVTWLGYVFYALNYYVPDLAVFLIPAHLVLAVLWGVGLAGLLGLFAGEMRLRPGQIALPVGLKPLAEVLPIIAVFPVMISAVQDTWPAVDASGDDGRTDWGRAVLELPLEPGAAILADSDKFPPLYYLQQAEGLRTDMDIVVLPDEAAYRAELETRLADNQTVYLARFLPGLEGLYHLRSAGPLTEVSPKPLTTLPTGVTSHSQDIGPVRLLGYHLDVSSDLARGDTAVTFYWQAPEEPLDLRHIYVRWAAQEETGAPAGQHPANNYYPTLAWRPGEVVPDFHTVARPVTNQPQDLALQVALAPPFTPASELSWETVTTARIEPTSSLRKPTPLRMQVGPARLEGIEYAVEQRPQPVIPLLIEGCGPGFEELVFTLRPALQASEPPWQAEELASGSGECQPSYVRQVTVNGNVAAGRYNLFVLHPENPSLCGWLAGSSEGCVLGETTISGVPLPARAINFDDQFALLEAIIPEEEVQPGGQVAVNLTWLGLAPISEAYTVFVQVLDERDRIVGQVDSWPLQGTFPTDAWRPGETVEDPYLVRLSDDLPPGTYRVQVGWYLLATLRRLPVLDETGLAVDDKVTVGTVVRR